LSRFLDAPERLAIVTGSTSGIGLEVVIGLCKLEGFRVVLCNHRFGRGLPLLDSLNARGLYPELVDVDVAVPVSVHTLVELVESTNNSVLDVLVCCAAVSYPGKLYGHKEAELTMKTNVHGLVDVVDRMIPYLRNSTDGRVIKYAQPSSIMTPVAPVVDACRFFHRLNDC
jgi:NAD(P)-dependent dehydrogenase (short-subunit alcohol dehydrogenase family)